MYYSVSIHHPASVHLAPEAVADDPFDEWEAEPVVGFRLTEA